MPRCHTSDMRFAGPAAGAPSEACGCDSTKANGQGYPSVRDARYRTDNFMMYGFKIVMCSRHGRHPWADCPFAHPTENARRRDPRLFAYSCMECPSYRNRGFCDKGDSCEFAHGIFEARLHPDSYRTIRCTEGANCRRKICFFYHSEEERRQPTRITEARAQLSAELGEAALTMQPHALQTVANSIIASNSTIGDTLRSLDASLSQPLCHHQTMRSPSCMPAAPASPTALSRVLSGPFGASSAGTPRQDALLSAETVAPCLKGANRHRLMLRKLADKLAMRADHLTNALRIAAMNGELSAFSQSSCAPAGTFPQEVEDLVTSLSEVEECPVEKLRGWLARTIPPGSPCSPRWKEVSKQVSQEFGLLPGMSLDSPSGQLSMQPAHSYPHIMKPQRAKAPLVQEMMSLSLKSSGTSASAFKQQASQSDLQLSGLHSPALMANSFKHAPSQPMSSMAGLQPSSLAAQQHSPLAVHPTRLPYTMEHTSQPPALVSTGPSAFQTSTVMDMLLPSAPVVGATAGSSPFTAWRPLVPGDASADGDQLLDW